MKGWAGLGAVGWWALVSLFPWTCFLRSGQRMEQSGGASCHVSQKKWDLAKPELFSQELAAALTLHRPMISGEPCLAEIRRLLEAFWGGGGMA